MVEFSSIFEKKTYFEGNLLMKNIKYAALLILLILIGAFMSSFKPHAQDAILKTDVLIVGAGPVGSLASNEFSSLNISHIIADKRSQILDAHPRAQSINARSMQFLLKHKISDLLRKEAYLGKEYFPGIILSDDFLPDQEPLKLSLEHITPEEESLSPERELRVAQWKTDRALRDKIEESSYANLMLDYQVVDIQDHGTHVETTLLDKETGREYLVHSKYVIAADGAHSFVRNKLNITTTQKDISIPLLNINFISKDMEEKIPFEKAYLYYLKGGKTPAATGPIDNNGLWYAQIVYPEMDEYTPQEAENLLKDYLKIDFDCSVLKAYVWHMRANIADQYRKGNIFLIGDAAHSMYATGGLGMNTGFGDAQNLAWKIAANLQGYGSEKLLDSYEPERKPVALENMHASSLNLRNALDMSGSVKAKELPQMQADAFSKHASNPERELGYFYDYSEVMPHVSKNGYPQEESFVALAYPGHFAPHIWLDESTSLYHQLGSQYTLLCTKEGKEAEVAKIIAKKLGVPLQVIEVDSEKLSEMYPAYTLIRPDWHIVWTGDSFTDHFEETLIASLGNGVFEAAH